MLKSRDRTDESSVMEEEEWSQVEHILCCYYRITKDSSKTKKSLARLESDKPLTNTPTKIKNQKARNSEYYPMQDCFDKLYQNSLEGKQFTNLTAKIFSDTNIRLAFRNIKTNAGSKTPGVDGKTIKDIAEMDERDVCQFVRKITRHYSPKPVKRKEIPKPNGKMRPLGIPCIWDRLVQQCILQILEPIMEAKFSENSHGFRPLRSAEHAIASCYNLVNVSQLRYVIELDIEGFFDNVNHSKLIRQLWSLGIQDKKLISIIRQILKAKVSMPNGDLVDVDKGTPQGGILSPLLANVVLNEFDRWIESQWQNNPVTEKYHQTQHEGRNNGKGTAFRGMRRTTKLKEMYIVRYADDVRIFCRTHKDAVKTMHAVTDWLSTRLHLEVSKEKTRIVDISKGYSEFLGIKFKMDLANPKKTVVSHVCDKAMKRIRTELTDQIKTIQHNKHSMSLEVFKWNSMIRGMHNYYRMATRVGQDFTRIAFDVNLVMYNRLKNYGITQTGSIPAKSKDLKKYGEAKTTRYIGDLYLLPINYVKSQKTRNKRVLDNIYTPKGREKIHDYLEIPNIGIMLELEKNPIPNQSLEYNDNRISKFAGQQGKCAISGRFFTSYEDIHTHHTMPKEFGGDDSYNNLALVEKDIHVLIHATRKDTITAYLIKCNLDKASMERLNKFREKAGNFAI